MKHQLKTHNDYNQMYLRSIKFYRLERNFSLARVVLGKLRLIRKLQKQCGVK